MKKSIYILVLSLLCASCIPKIDDEGVVPDQYFDSFTYGGYVYYVHPSLGEMTHDQAMRACMSLKSYGYHDWILPSREILSRCPSTRGRDIWTSEKVNAKDYYALINIAYEECEKSCMLEVIPIRKGEPSIAMSSAFEIPEANIAMMEYDIGFGEWQTMESLCQASSIDGYSNWRLPTENELRTIYYRTGIFGFEDEYWTSYPYEYFSMEYIGSDQCHDSYRAAARCVRSLK